MYKLRPSVLLHGAVCFSRIPTFRRTLLKCVVLGSRRRYEQGVEAEVHASQQKDK